MSDQNSEPGWRALALWRKAIYFVIAVVIGSIGAAIGGIVGYVAGDVGLTIGSLLGWVAGTWLVLTGIRDDIDYVTSHAYAERNPGGARNWP